MARIKCRGGMWALLIGGILGCLGLRVASGLSIGMDPLLAMDNNTSMDTMGRSNESTTGVGVEPLDPKELEEAALLEEEEMEEEIVRSEQELEAMLKGEGNVGDPSTQPVVPINKEEGIKAKAVENLMHMFGLPYSKPPPSGPAPEFMIELYNTITDSSGVTRANNPFGAHIVRSFLEKDASLSDYFYFNISLQGLSESVLEAELHLFRLDTPRAQLHPSLYLNPFYVLSLYQVLDPSKLHIPALHKLLSVAYVPALGTGWQVFNVKKAVSEWLSGHSENHGFLVSAESVYGNKVPIRFARRAETVESKQPILVLFNNDSNAKVIPVTPSPQPPRKVLKKRVNKMDSNEEGEEGDTGSMQYTYESTTPLSSLENPQFHHTLLFQDSIHHPNSVSRFRSRRSRNETTTASHMTSVIPSNLTSCSRHDLFVSFESIGWSSWVISPKGYNAHFCSGPCVFPLGKDVKPTNHATVQSIINELNLNPGLSRPCCVPTTLLPISLLYYDDTDNVVLKQYVDMVAESCGCQ